MPPGTEVLFFVSSTFSAGMSRADAHAARSKTARLGGRLYKRRVWFSEATPRWPWWWRIQTFGRRRKTAFMTKYSTTQGSSAAEFTLGPRAGRTRGSMERGRVRSPSFTENGSEAVMVVMMRGFAAACFGLIRIALNLFEPLLAEFCMASDLWWTPGPRMSRFRMLASVFTRR